MIELLDISHWNQIKDWSLMVAKGIKGVYIKFSQGVAFADTMALEHYENAKRVGLKVGAYHFVTKTNGIIQYDWFIKQIRNLKFDLMPMLDCEAYNGLMGLYETRLSFAPTMVEKEVFPVLELRYGNINQEAFQGLSDTLGYTYPTEAIVDVIGSRLKNFQNIGEYPIIYTNPSSGNAIFKTKSMKKYPLDIAHWGVQKPTMPTVWKGEPYYMWQDNVVDGAPYGVVYGKVDHNFWGTKVAFPGDVPEPEPEPTEEILAKAYIGSDLYQGILKKG